MLKTATIYWYYTLLAFSLILIFFLFLLKMMAVLKFHRGYMENLLCGNRIEHPTPPHQCTKPQLNDNTLRAEIRIILWSFLIFFFITSFPFCTRFCLLQTPHRTSFLILFSSAKRHTHYMMFYKIAVRVIFGGEKSESKGLMVASFAALSKNHFEVTG